MAIDNLRSNLIRLASTNPTLRPHLLPLLLKEAGSLDLRFALERLAMEPNLSSVKIQMGRGYWGPTVNLISVGRDVNRTEEDENLTCEPHKLKTRQFGKLELRQSFLPEDKLPEGARDALKGSKSYIKRNDFSTVFSVSSVFVNRDFQGQGYGLAMYLKALDYVSSKGFWMTNDTKVSTSGSAATTWKALFRYAVKTLEGPPLPQKLFDYEKQEWAMGYRGRSDKKDIVVNLHRPVYAAFGLNGRGRAALEPLVG